MKKILLVSTLFLFLLCGTVAFALPVDLSTFTADGDVSVSGGIVTIDETNGFWSSYFYNDFFVVGNDDQELSFDYELSSGDDDIDWLVMIIDDGVDYWYDLEVSGNFIGSHSFDLTPYQGSSISVTFGLEADSSDWGYDSVATFSNIDVASATNSTPVPEPSTILLMGIGLLGLVGYRKKIKT